MEGCGLGLICVGYGLLVGIDVYFVGVVKKFLIIYLWVDKV